MKVKVNVNHGYTLPIKRMVEDNEVINMEHIRAQEIVEVVTVDDNVKNGLKSGKLLEVSDIKTTKKGE